MRALVQRLFFEHFGPTSFLVTSPEGALAFLIGFRSQSHVDTGYIHFVGVHPDLRGRGVGRFLYERFFDSVRSLGCTRVECITSPTNRNSVAFHRRMGFELLQGDGEVDGLPVALNHSGDGQHRVLFRKLLQPERDA